MDIKMNLTSDLLEFQGILAHLAPSGTDQLINIKYRGGNEMTINRIINGIKSHLELKRYLLDQICNPTNKKEIQDIVLFLTLNTDFSAKSSLNENSIYHLCNNSTKLSKCLLANIVTELDLAQAYASVFAMLPLPLSAEMLPELLICIKKCPPVIFRIQAFYYLKEIIQKLSTADTSLTENSRYFKEIEDATIQILLYLSQFNVDLAQNFSKKKVYQHIGHIVLGLSDLILCCQMGNDSLGRILDSLIRTCCIVYRAVSVDVYIEWAEFDLDDGLTLQQKIAYGTYGVIERYHKYKPAKELIQMFSTVAKKPPTLTEFIHLSSVETMVAKVNQLADSKERQEWFTAMLNTAVFDNDEVINCLNKWYKLCTLDDVVRILDLSVKYDSEDVKKLSIKCAGGLETEDLNIAIVRYYRQHGLNKNLLIKTTSADLTILMNKIHNSTNVLIINEIYLLLLQNVKLVTDVLFTECIKSSVFTLTLESTYSCIKNIIMIENLSKICLDKCFDNCKLNEENLENYIKLIEVLKRTECIRKEEEMLYFMLKTSYENNLPNELLLILKIINAINVSNYNADILTLFLNILNKSRCRFFDFSQLKIDICREAIYLLNRNTNQHKTELDEVFAECETLTTKLNLYYTNLEENKKSELLHYIYPKFDIENYSDAVSKILKVFPSCVLEEWLNISNSIEKSYGIDAFLEILTDTLLLICQVAGSVKTNEDEIRAALQYCLTNYGIIMQKTVLNEDHTKNNELQRNFVRKICFLMKQIIPSVQENEGFKLLGLVNEDVLKSLKSDSSFVKLVNSIGNSKLSEAIVKRMQ